ncbi:hypothetical protein ACMDCR_24885 [Labrys okinawensis]|uniref:hypothetical protein n=1 Tax=Labrys okinawensis TaxID=346911 RepID=UPI0039BC5171
MSISNTTKEDRISKHKRGDLTRQQLDERVAEVWSETLASDFGRKRIAAALRIKPEDLHPGPPPVEIQSPSGLDPTLLYAVIHWTATSIVVPVFVGMVKDEVKERMTRLWKEVLLPAIRSDNRTAIGD